MPARRFTRREAFRLTTQGRGGGPAVPPVPRTDLVNTLEFEEQARRRLPPAVYAQIAGSRRDGFDRITLRPRMCVPVMDMSLSVTLFGDAHFAPIVVAPIENQRRFHPEGELATIRGAGTAKAAVVVSARSSVPLAEIAAATGGPIWYQAFTNDPDAATKIQDAARLGCRAACLTVGAPLASDWQVVRAAAQRGSVPIIVKGITTPQGARLAIANGAQGIVVSTYTRPGANPGSPILALPAIVDAVDGRVPVLVDGSFRRGTDIIKALAFGARAVLVGRPVMWGLAAYGGEGAQGVIEMLQTELARYMGMCGKPALDVLDRTLLKVHSRG
jgi:4-hydroxymandelate oxidase